MRARLDLPVVWLIVALGSAWALTQIWPIRWGGTLLSALGMALAVVSGGLILWAVATMRGAGTPVMPGQMPQMLVMQGPFRFSRNPIYLGMAGLLASAALIWQAPQSLFVVPAFMSVIERRFIAPEEQRLAVAFGAQYELWTRHVGRWLRLLPQSSNQALK